MSFTVILVEAMFRMVAFWAFALAALHAARAQETAPALPQETVLLARVKQHMRQLLVRQPNYTCQMSVERSRRRNPKRAFELLDRLRLEVALVDGKELYSWPGARKFDERELRDMVGGTSATGSFALHARAVYFGTTARFHYAGGSEEAGRTVHTWRFDVPQFLSGYKLRVDAGEGAAHQAIVGYHGEIDIDGATLDMMRLSYTADEIPPALGIESTTGAIAYQRLRIGTEDFLLPVSSDLSITDRDGSTNINRTRFHNCRQYAGESALIFDNPPAPASPAVTPVPPPSELPAGLVMETGLEEAVTHPAVTGDPIRLVLERPARMKGRVLLPKGAVVLGRILRSGTLPARMPLTYFTILFERIEAGNYSFEAPLRLDDVLPAQLGASRQMVLDFEPSQRKPLPGHYTIAITGNRPVLRKGLRLVLSVIPSPEASSSRK